MYFLDIHHVALSLSEINFSILISCTIEVNFVDEHVITHTHAHTHTYIYTHTHTCTYTHTHTHTHTYTHVYMCTCIMIT